MLGCLKLMEKIEVLKDEGVGATGISMKRMVVYSCERVSKCNGEGCVLL